MQGDGIQRENAMVERVSPTQSLRRHSARNVAKLQVPHAAEG
jgi:hypothetical protein